MRNGLLNFPKAFDYVDHTILMKKLTVITEQGSCRLIIAYRGIPQGSVRPLLFSLFINDLADVGVSSQVHMYTEMC